MWQREHPLICTHEGSAPIASRNDFATARARRFRSDSFASEYGNMTSKWMVRSFA
jgi:hypothetical protein